MVNDSGISDPPETFTATAAGHGIGPQRSQERKQDAEARFELYDTGATNMFRQTEHDAVAGSVRKLSNPRSVTTADKGVVPLCLCAY